MKITIDVSYEALHIPPRCKKAREIQIKEPLEVEIREAAIDDAPIAIRFAEKEEDPVTELRWWDGRLWEPVDKGIDDLGRRLGDVNSWMTWAVNRAEAESDPKVGFLYDTGKAGEARREAKAIAARHALIGSVLHVTAREPYWEASVLGSGHGYIKLADWDADQAAKLTAALEFRADQLELAKERLAAYVAESHSTTIRGVCEVFIPAALRLDPQAAGLRRELHQVITTIEDLTHTFERTRSPGHAGLLGEAVGQAVRDLSVKIGWSHHERLAFLGRLNSAFSAASETSE